MAVWISEAWVGGAENPEISGEIFGSACAEKKCRRSGWGKTGSLLGEKMGNFSALIRSATTSGEILQPRTVADGFRSVLRLEVGENLKQERKERGGLETQ
jgi:hypothetical protein